MLLRVKIPPQSTTFKRLRQCFNLDINQQRNSLSSRWRELDCNSGWLHTLRQQSTPTDSEWFSRFSKLGTTTMMHYLKVWVFCSTCKEVAECSLKVSQSMLVRNTANFCEKSKFFFLFPLHQHGRSFNMPNPLLFFLPCLRPSRQCTIIDKTSTTHRSSQQVFMFRSWIESVLESFPCHISRYSTLLVNNVDLLMIFAVQIRLTYCKSNRSIAALIPPCAEATEFPRGF